MSEAAPQVLPLGGGCYEVVDGDRRRFAYAVRDQSGTWVFLDGRTYVIAPTAGRGMARASRADDETALAAPMPATVVSVHVAPGQQVAQGDVLITLEAMKMEIAIKAPRAAVVGEIQCRPGDLVQPGRPLLALGER